MVQNIPTPVAHKIEYAARLRSLLYPREVALYGKYNKLNCIAGYFKLSLTVNASIV